MALAGAAFNSKHSRGPGGLFAAQSAAAGRPTGAWARGPIQSGHAQRNTVDPRVSALQQALNRLGVTDERGRPLKVDGMPGDHTSAAIKKWQQANGMKPAGTVDAKTMVALLTAKPAPKKTARSMMRHTPTHAGRKTSPKKTTTSVARTRAAAYLAASNKRGQSRNAGLI